MTKNPTDWLKKIARRRGVKREDAEDIAQEVTLRMCRHVREGGVIHNQEAFLKRATVNVATDVYRVSLKKGDEVPLEDVSIVDCAPTPDEQYSVEQLIKRVSALLEHRSPNIRRAFWLHRVYGRDQSEVARMLSVSVSAVEKYIATAVRELALARHQFE